MNSQHKNTNSKGGDFILKTGSKHCFKDFWYAEILRFGMTNSINNHLRVINSLHKQHEFFVYRLFFFSQSLFFYTTICNVIIPNCFLDTKYLYM